MINTSNIWTISLKITIPLKMSNPKSIRYTLIGVKWSRHHIVDTMFSVWSIPWTKSFCQNLSSFHHFRFISNSFQIHFIFISSSSFRFHRHHHFVIIISLLSFRYRHFVIVTLQLSFHFRSYFTVISSMSFRFHRHFIFFSSKSFRHHHCWHYRGCRCRCHHRDERTRVRVVVVAAAATTKMNILLFVL